MSKKTINKSISRIINISNEYVTNGNKDSWVTTHGQKKLKFSSSQAEVFLGKNDEIEIVFNRKNIISFMDEVIGIWKYLLNNTDRTFKKVDFDKMIKICNDFKNSLTENIIFEKINMGSFSQNRSTIDPEIYTKYIYQLGIPYITYLVIDKKESNVLEINIFNDISAIGAMKEIGIGEKGRKGQSKLRDTLINKNSCCQITNINNTSLLVASHIKPWYLSEDDEKVDINNVLLLSGTFDKLFDSGLMTFSKEGNIVFSDIIEENDLSTINNYVVNKNIKISEKMENYMKFHREHVFKVVNLSLKYNLL